MNYPKIKRTKTGDRHYEQAHQIWVILVAFVMGRRFGFSLTGPRKLTYGDLAIQMGYYDRRAGHTLGRQLGLIGKHCVNNDIPTLNVVVVNQITGEPGNEVIVRPGMTVADEQDAIFEFDWFSLRVPPPGTFRTLTK